MRRPIYKYFYPTSYMETGLRHPVLLGGAHDHERTGIHRAGSLPHRVPARLIRDEHGRKMSKTYGNVIDPLTCHG